MAISFPTQLPNPDVEYSGKIESPVASSEFETGEILVRKRFTSEIERVGLLYKFTQFEYAIFRAFFTDALKGGVLPFIAPIKGVEGLVNKEISIPSASFSYNGFGYSDVQVRIEARVTNPNISTADDLNASITAYAVFYELEGFELDLFEETVSNITTPLYDYLNGDFKNQMNF